MFREGRPFLQKVASETPPGGHFYEFEAILMPFGGRLGYFLTHFGHHVSCAFFRQKKKRFLEGPGGHGGGSAQAWLGGGIPFRTSLERTFWKASFIRLASGF